MPIISGTGTQKEIATQAASLNLDLTIPKQPVEPLFHDDPLPSLAEGEGLQEPLGFLERTELGYQIASPTYNVLSGMRNKDYDPVVDPDFNVEDHIEIFRNVDDDSYSYLVESTSFEDLEHRKQELSTEQRQMQLLMKDGVASGMAYMMAAGTVGDPIFWAGVAVEGAGAFNVISKTERILRMGALAGSTATLETAILAGTRATVDSEDVLYAGLAGLALGTGVSAIADKFLTKGDDFVRASDAVQDNFSKTGTKVMDENLAIKPKRHTEETDSIFGRFDPDEVAQRKAELEPGEIRIVPEEEIDEAAGYADALYKNIDDAKAAGTFDPQTVLDSKTFKVLAKNPLMSDFMKLFKSDSDGIRYLAMNILENASGVAGRQKTAAILKHVEERRLLQNTMPILRRSFKEYAKKNKIGIISRQYWGKAREDHFNVVRTELERYRNASSKGTVYTSDAPEYIQDAVNAWRKGMKDAAELARVSGVRGFDEFKVLDGYVPLLWNGNKMARLPKASLKAYTKLLARGYQRAGIDAKSAQVIAKAVFNRKTKQARGMDTNPGALLSKDSREFLREMLELNNVSKTEQEALFGRIDITLAERGKAARAKGRVPVDLTVSDGEKTLTDIVDNDLASIGSRYFTEMAGRSALARKGIRHDGAWRAIKNAVLKEAFDNGEDTTALAQTLDGVYMQFLGQPVGEGVSRPVRRLMELAMTSMLGTVGMAQMAESANVIAAHGVANLMKYSPDLKSYRNALKTGTADDTLLGELQAHLGGLWDEHLFYRPEVRLDQARGDTDGIWQVLDNVLAGSKQFVGYASGLNSIKNLQQQFTVLGQSNKVVKMLRDGTDTDKLLARFKDIGWDDNTLAGIKAKIDDGTITFQDNGSVDKLNLEQWDAKTLEDFTTGMHRHSAQIIQFPLIGETAYWQHETIGAALSQFRTFSMLAIEKQTARNVRIFDEEAFLAFNYSLGLSTLIYMTKVHAVAIGRPDKEEYLERRLSPQAIFNGALQWSGMFSIASEAVNASAATGLIPADWGSGSVGRGGASAFSLDKQVPAFSVARSGMKLTTGVLTGLSPFSEHTIGDKEIDNFFASIPLGNIYPSILLKNNLHKLTQGD